MKEKIKQTLLRKWDIPFFRKISNIVAGFSATERAFFYVFCGIFIVSAGLLLDKASRAYMVAVPERGGELTEGIIGTPRFVNPVLAVSDADNDLTELIYSGLVKDTPEGGLVGDLAESWTISPDGLTYTFKLRPDATFQDGTKVTADDVVFTIGKIEDSAIKSPKRPEFYDVSVEKVDDETVEFTLKKPYAPFLETLTVGILPKHLWNDLTDDEFPLSQYNIEPVGSGPYKVAEMHSTQKDMLLIPTSYELEPFGNYALGEPYIATLDIRLYRDEKSLIAAYNKGDIEAMNSISPDSIPSVKLQGGAKILAPTLPREFAVFFNQNQSPALSDLAVRQALNMSVDRKRIVSEVLDGEGAPIDGPVPSALVGEAEDGGVAFDIDGAKALLQKDGWTFDASSSVWEKNAGKKNEIDLEVTISTLNTPDLEKAAEIIKEDWQELGADVSVQEFDFGSLEQNVIRPRKFEALLYGLAVGRDLDFFAFWHSSQRNDPGLNISMYANSKVDALLSDARTSLDPAERLKDYLSFESDIEADVPAVFVYSPDFLYVVPGKVKGLDLGAITDPYERFLGVNDWYIETNDIWTIFENKKQQSNQ